MESVKVEPKKYYTAFVMFAQESTTRKTVQLHCTHKYLGEMDGPTVSRVALLIHRYFKTPRIFPLVQFNERVDFLKLDGTTVSVLKSFIHKDAFFPDLRAQLDEFRKDDYPEYIPHITVPGYPNVMGHFQAYAIMSGEQILTYWRNPKWEAIERKAKRGQQ